MNMFLNVVFDLQSAGHFPFLVCFAPPLDRVQTGVPRHLYEPLTPFLRSWLGGSGTRSSHPHLSSSFPCWTALSVVRSFTHTGPGCFAAASYAMVSFLDRQVIDFTGTKAAAVPAARTSENLGNSVYGI